MFTFHLAKKRTRAAQEGTLDREETLDQGVQQPNSCCEGKTRKAEGVNESAKLSANNLQG